MATSLHRTDSAVLNWIKVALYVISAAAGIAALIILWSS